REARKLGVAPRRHVLDQRVATVADLSEGSRKLRKRIAAERRERRERREARRAERASAPAEAYAEDAPATGVAGGTLNSIAACESGGDPAAVNPAGYYGKYQFDLGTWQSVGGSG